MTSFLQGPTANYNAQSGEIVGVLKNMNDTFTANLANARQVEAKALADFTAMKKVLDEEYDEASDLFEKRKTAIAEAVAVLNSDAAFETFGKVSATSTGATSFIQTSASQNKDAQKVRAAAGAALATASKKLHSMRLAKIAMELSTKSKAENPFTKVLENINSTVELIEAEEADDAQKLATCNSEQDINFAKRDAKKEKMDDLTATIGQLEISAKNTRKEIADEEEDLAENRADQKEATDARNEQNAVFKENLKNLEDAERILAKATKVLVKYYKYLHSHTAEKTYKEVDGKDSGGGNLKQITPGFSDPAKIDAECVAYNSAGWLKSSLAPEDEWYAWDGGKLFIKELNGVPATEAGTKLIQTKSKSKQPEDVDFANEDAEFADSQSGSGNKVIDMLNFIASETAEEKKTAIDTEESAVDTFDGEMKTAKDAEKGMVEAIDGFELDLANTEKSLEEANAELASTTDEHTATVAYLDDIEPGCTFIQQNYDGRKAAREAEKAALANAVSTLKATPIFQRFLAEAEKEAMGKCAPLCEGDLEPTAECQACLQGVSVFGYCVTNPDTPGCDKAK